ncbi:MAG TPA: prepilin-type N-terminal cleavage/methylation domain-containing protein [Candidatus Kryptonia bacterium]|nr:prepilin-type N-terminal cleavage/methylation domain-containing protein [Candidatus Kryptonia bacterium]
MCNRPRSERGWTLLELLVAITILAIVLTTVYGALSRTLTQKSYAEDRAELYAVGREAALKIAEDLEAALPPSPTAGISFFGISRGDRPPNDAVQFSINTHSGLRAAVLSSGRSTVSYSLVPLAENENVFELLRDEMPFALTVPENDESAPADVPQPSPPMRKANLLLEKSDCAEQRFCLVGMRLRYLDATTGEWLAEWDSTQQAQLNRLPAAAEIALFLSDNNGNVHDFTTIVDLVLASAVPTPTPGGGLTGTGTTRTLGGGPTN